MTPILADENVPLASVHHLRGAGFDIKSVVELKLGMPDFEVLEVARSEQRLLWTFDRDFGELIFRRGHRPPPAVIYMRLIPVSPDEPALVLLKLFGKTEIQLTGRLTVVNRDQVRQRPLPQ
ncbi:MAG: DUF5615 family PIN-like protein [Gemmatimonadota bacterium]